MSSPALLSVSGLSVEYHPVHRRDADVARVVRDVSLDVQSGKVLAVVGQSGSGKSTLAMGFLERLEEQGYQYVVVDPEGDYSMFEGYRVKGNARTVMSRGEVIVDNGQFLGKAGRGQYLKRTARGGAWK